MIAKLFYLYSIFEGSSNCRNQKASLSFGEKCKLRMIMWQCWFALAKHLDSTVCFIKREGKTNYLLLSNTSCIKSKALCSCMKLSTEVSQRISLMLLSVHTENKAAHWIYSVLLAGKSCMSSALWGGEEWGLVGHGHCRQEVLLVLCHRAEQKSQVQMLVLLLTLNKSVRRSLLRPLTSWVLILRFGWGLSVSPCQHSI